MYQWIRRLAASVLTLVAIRHVVLAITGQGDVVRHWVFVGINLGLAALLVLRPRWAFWASIAVGAQQMYSHGLDLSRSFLGSATLDWPSLAVCLFFPTLVTMLFIERR